MTDLNLSFGWADQIIGLLLVFWIFGTIQWLGKAIGEAVKNYREQTKPPTPPSEPWP